MLGLGLNRDGGAGLAAGAAGLACNAGLSDGRSISCAPLPGKYKKKIMKSKLLSKVVKQ